MRKLRGLKSIAIVLGIIIGVVASTAFFTVTAIRLARTERATIRQQTQAFATLATKPIITTYLDYKDAIGVKLVTSMRPLAQNMTAVDYFQIVDLQGKVVYDSRSLKRSTILETITDTEVIKAIQSSSPSEFRTRDNSLIIPYFSATGEHTHSIRYFANLTPIQAGTRALLIQSIIVGLFLTAGLVFFLSWLTQRFILGPINEMRADMNVMTAGDYSRSIRYRSKHELGHLAQSINTMVDTLTKSLRSLEEEKAWKDEFLILASHNLRTPLTVVMSSVASLKKDDKLSTNSKKFVDFIYSRGKELHALIENLLSISTLKGDKPRTVKEPYNLVTLAENIAKQQELRLKEKGQSIAIETKEKDITIQGDENQIFQVLDNLIDNAIKYTPEKGKITVSLDQTRLDATIVVQDDGAGIPEDMIKKLFQSFRRGENPLSVDHRGAGLGLYYVKLAVEAQGGTVAIKSKQNEGTEVTIRLPKG